MGLFLYLRLIDEDNFNIALDFKCKLCNLLFLATNVKVSIILYLSIFFPNSIFVIYILKKCCFELLIRYGRYPRITTFSSICRYNNRYKTNIIKHHLEEIQKLYK